MAVPVPDLFENLTARQLLIRYNSEPTSLRAQPLLLRKLRQMKVAVLDPRPRAKLGDVVWEKEKDSFEVRIVESHRHHPRSVPACIPGNGQTAFWVNFVMACKAGPSTQDAGSGAGPDRAVSKKLGTLPNAIHNLHALRSFYEPHRIGAPDIEPVASMLRSAGYFSHTLLLADPDADAVKTAVNSACHWLTINQQDPEFDSFQLNIFFSGHGGAGNEAGQRPARDESYLVIADGILRTTRLVELLLEGFATYGVQASQCAITLFFDCCFAAAIARDFFVALERQQAAIKPRLEIGNIACTTMHCSSLGDEESFDHTELDYSCFVSAYLHEQSVKKIGSQHPTLQTVAQRTGQRQHPLILTKEKEEMKVRFPTLLRQDRSLLREQPWYGLGDIELVRNYAQWFFERGAGLSQTSDIEWIDRIMLRAHLTRDFCKERTSGRA